MGKGDTLLNAGVGAAVTVLVSFLGVSPLLGGAVAGYLQRESRESGAKVGAISGVLASLPYAGLLFLIFGVVLTIPVVDGGIPIGGLGVLVVGFVVFVGVFLWSVVLSAVGGFLGTYLREEFDSSSGGSVSL